MLIVLVVRISFSRQCRMHEWQLNCMQSLSSDHCLLHPTASHEANELYIHLLKIDEFM